MAHGEGRRVRRGVAWLIAPPRSLRRLREEGQPRLLTLATRRLLFVALAVIGGGMLLGTHAAHQPLLGVARQLVLLLGAVLVLVLSGRLEPPMRLLSGWAAGESRHRDGTRRGRLLSIVARLYDPTSPHHEHLTTERMEHCDDVVG